MSIIPTYKWQSSIDVIAKHERLRSVEDTLSSSSSSSSRYDVSTWLLYLDEIDAHIQELRHQQQQQQQQAGTCNKKTSSVMDPSSISLSLQDLIHVRDFVGRRAVRHLPRSYKLWKSHWEFVVLQQEQQQQLEQQQVLMSSQTVLDCFQHAARTMSPFPRFWIAVFEFWKRHPEAVALAKDVQQQQQQQYRLSESYDESAAADAAAAATGVVAVTADADAMTVLPTVMTVTAARRLINRALQAVPVTQHDKLWPTILDWILMPSLRNKEKIGETKADLDADGNLRLQEEKRGWIFPIETVQRLLKRYATFHPSYWAEYATWCESQELYGPAAIAYQTLLNQDGPTAGAAVAGSGSTRLLSSSSSGTASAADGNMFDEQSSTTTAWQAFTLVCTQHSFEVEQAGVPWEAILRSVLDKQHQRQTTSTTTTTTRGGSSVGGTTVSMVGLLYSQLASAWIQRGAFDLARTVYEQGLAAVSTIRDFAVLYGAYQELEQGLLQAAVSALEEEESDSVIQNQTTSDGTSDDDDDDDWDLLLEHSSTSPLAEMELALARAEHMTRRRPLLLNAVRLRQNPNDVSIWLQRAELYLQQELAGSAAHALEDGLKTVQASHAMQGTLSDIVTRLSCIYVESLHDVRAARDLFQRVCVDNEITFYKAQDLAECWAAWIELELAQEAWDDALSLARQSVAPVAKYVAVAGKKRAPNLTKSLRLWDLLLDLEESLGTVQTTKDAYNRAVEIKAATAQHVLNYASFLSEHKYFEESFAAYQKGLELFGFPHPGAKLLWKAYLSAFIGRFHGTKVERSRDLFERCLESCPAEECAEFFMMHGSFEEEYGLTKRALSVYKALCQKVSAEEKYTAYQLYIAKTAKYLGLTATRDIYEEAIEALDDKSSVKMCIDFANMESGLQQFERARAVYSYGAQMADPRRLPEFWKAWNDFEITHGNEETFREMLRIKRSVEAAFSTVNYNATAMSESVGVLSHEEAMNMIAEREGMDLDLEHEQSASKPVIAGFVPSTKRPAPASLGDVEERVAKLRKATGTLEVAPSGNQDENEIDLDVEDENDENEIDIGDIDAEIEAAAAEGEKATEAETGSED